MRKWLLLPWLVMLLASCGQYKVFSVRERPNGGVSGGVLYALPHTSIQVTVTVDYQDFSAAPFAPFAEELLGLAMPADDSLYSMRSIAVSTRDAADPDGYYFVVPRGLAVEVDGRGLLRSIGLPSTGTDEGAPLQNVAMELPSNLSATTDGAEYNLYERSDTFYTRNDRPGHPSLVLTAKDVRSLRQRAVAAAEHIEEIRERKEALLFGQYEGGYSDEGLRFLYQQLERQEELYLASFVGRCRSEKVVFEVDPAVPKGGAEDETVALFWFSPSCGICDSLDEGAVPVYCTIRCDNSMRKAARFVKYRSRKAGRSGFRERHSFKYRIPETACVTVFSEAFRFSKQVKISQFGTIAHLPMGRCEARFDPFTGELIYYK